MAGSEQSKEMYRLIFPGNILPGTDHDEVVFELARLLKASPDRAIRLVSGKRRYVKRAFPYERADKLRVQVLELGVECELEPIKGGDAAKKDGSRRKKSFSKPDNIAMQPAKSTMDDADSPSDQVYSDKMAAFEKHAKVEREQKAQEPQKNKSTTFDEAILSFNDELDDTNNSRALSGDKLRLAQFVGDNDGHYIKTFDKFLSGGTPHFVFSWNWPAFFVPFFWAIYRELWLWAIVILVSLVLLPLVSNIVWGVLANYIYFRHAIKVIKKIRKRTPSSELDETLRKKGGTSTLVLTAIILTILLTLNVLYWTKVLTPVFSELSENLENIEQQKARAKVSAESKSSQ